MQDEDLALAAIVAVGDGVVDGLAHHFFVVEGEIEEVEPVGNVDFVVSQVDVRPQSISRFEETSGIFRAIGVGDGMGVVPIFEHDFCLREQPCQGRGFPYQNEGGVGKLPVDNQSEITEYLGVVEGEKMRVALFGGVFSLENLDGFGI